MNRPAASTRTLAGLPLRSVVVPVLALLVLWFAWGRTTGWALDVVVVAALVSAVLVAVYHAEVIAHRVGEPFGTLVLALAVTVIESSLIVSMMLAGGADADTLARDTVFATVMIVCNGVIGLCLLSGALRHRVVAFRAEGTVPATAVLTTLATLVLVVPNFTVGSAGPTFARSQMIFVGAVSLALWLCFVFVQTLRHRDYFLPEGESAAEHATPPSTATALASFGLLLVSLVAVVGLAKVLSPVIEGAVAGAGLPRAVVGIAIALLVLMPETLSALRAARSNRLQTSLNLALGSALATIGLTIPVVLTLAAALGLPLELGVSPTEITLLALSLLLTSMTMAAGRATILQGAVHLVVFAAYLFLAMVP